MKRYRQTSRIPVLLFEYFYQLITGISFTDPDFSFRIRSSR